MYTIYGIKNCDTMKKAFKWLDEQQVQYQFHNYKTDGLSAAQLQLLIDKAGWQALLNTRGTTWRKLDEAIRNTIDNESAAKQVMLENTSMIKRPVLINNSNQSIILGFSAESYQQFIEDNK